MSQIDLEVGQAPMQETYNPGYYYYYYHFLECKESFVISTNTHFYFDTLDKFDQGTNVDYGGGGGLWNARWQQTYQVNFHLRSSYHAHITENNGFYLVSLLPPSVPKGSQCRPLVDFTWYTQNVFHA